MDGKVCFIPGALPGEEVEVVPLARKRRFDRAVLRRVLRPSPERQDPLCSHLGICGGCSIQALRYEAQVREKAAQVRECLRRIGGIEAPEHGPPIRSPLLTAYRNKMEFTFATREWLVDGPPEVPAPGPALGLHVPGRFDAIFDIRDCALCAEVFVRVVSEVRDFARRHGLAAWRSRDDQGLLRHLIVRQGHNTGEVLVGLVVREASAAFEELARRLSEAVPSIVGIVLIINRRAATIARGEEEIVLSGRPYLTERLLDLTYEVGIQSFFQTNTAGAEALVTALREMLPSRAAADSRSAPGSGRLLDLYCGAGTLGLALAADFEHVTGVEQVPQAVADARRNARRNGLERVEFIEANVEDWLFAQAPRAVAPARQNVAATGAMPPASLARPFPSPWEGIVVDPPRAGLHPRALRALVATKVPWILYVSCNPSTLARDGALLVEGGYRPDLLQIVDMFPHTAHIESILRFRLAPLDP